MFDGQVVERVDADVAALAGLDLSTCTVAEVERLIRKTQAWTQTLQAVQARTVVEFEQRGGPEQAGCSTVSAWLRRELRLSAAQTRRRRRAGAALRDLPQVADALSAGAITLEHVDVFADAARRIGTPVVRDAQQLLLQVAVAGDTRDLRIACDRLRDATDPDAAERDWIHAQEKQDITCHRVGSGYQVTGWLSPETGAKLRTLLDSLAKPAHAEDDRPVAQRRIEGFDALLDGFLAGGLPTDHGIRPHLIVTVDADTFTAATRTGAPDAAGGNGSGAEASGGDRHTPAPQTPTPPATLHGYGHIDRDLLTRLACDATLTVLLIDGDTTEHRHGRCRGPSNTDPPGGDPPDASSGTDPPDRAPPGPDPGQDPPGPRHRCGCPLTPYKHVLDVGRAERIATARQRLAVLVAQDFRCATPGCANTHLQIHHIIPWLLGGRTDMTNLIGLCTSCHTLLHRGLLRCTSDGHGGATFHTADGTPIADTRRHVMSGFEHHLDTHLRRHTHLRLGVPPRPGRKPRPGQPHGQADAA